ncbi:helix-turn-helix domain-containing protein [Caldalkalibacillus mannanilyticus]|uniref:helix-turn-helix domain-containing protein n=1 Tax=Caldalkalibacillus mannanilyticus TaxID=1418 RepID=UPI00046930A6|nr:helix-turn-helix transcriptional regulator [Caldalkalibacillus mannanilyticus]
MGMQILLHRTLRSELERNMKERGYTISKTAELSGMNPGNLSGILNGNPPRAITIRQLDVLAKVFGYEQGWLYELYPEECISEGKVSRPRLIPYLVRCAEIGRQDCIEIVSSYLLENPKNLVILFSVAEQLFESGKKREALPFYEVIIDNEKDSYSDHFVISHYRVFRIKLGTNSEENLQATTRFAPYRKRLPENHQLDSLLQLTKASYSLQKFRDTEKYADELQELATLIYNDQIDRKKKGRTISPLRTEHHLVVYYGQGYLMKGLALSTQGQYEESIPYIHKYMDLGFFEILDDLGKQEVEKFRYWGQLNLYSTNLMIGKEKSLSQYVEFLENHPEEIFPGLLTILRIANQHGYDVDWVLDHFSKNIKESTNSDFIDMGRHIRFRKELALYFLKRGKVTEGIQETLKCLQLSDKGREYKNFKTCAESLLETLEKI